MVFTRISVNQIDRNEFKNHPATEVCWSFQSILKCRVKFICLLILVEVSFEEFRTTFLRSVRFNAKLQVSSFHSYANHFLPNETDFLNWRMSKSRRYVLQKQLNHHLTMCFHNKLRNRSMIFRKYSIDKQINVSEGESIFVSHFSPINIIHS